MTNFLQNKHEWDLFHFLVLLCIFKGEDDDFLLKTDNIGNCVLRESESSESLTLSSLPSKSFTRTGFFLTGTVDNKIK